METYNIGVNITRTTEKKIKITTAKMGRSKKIYSRRPCYITGNNT